jgi:hypothetical protein
LSSSAPSSSHLERHREVAAGAVTKVVKRETVRSLAVNTVESDVLPLSC